MGSIFQHESRFPFTYYPTGWFFAALSDDVPKGSLLNIKFCGQDVVLYRTESEILRAIDPFCPHLGAHLGHGGRVVGEELECPFHGWRFSTSGKCVDVPYSDSTPPQKSGRGCLKIWHVKEDFGVVYIWYDQLKRSPFFEIKFDERLYSGEFWSEPKVFKWVIDTHIQELVENSVDTAHFTKVHERTYKNILPNVDSYTFDEHFFQILTTSEFDVLGKKYPTQVSVRCDGLGVMHVESIFREGMGLHLIMAMKPIGPNRVELRAIISHVKSKNPMINLFQRLFAVNFFPNEVEHDLKIWKYKNYVEKPVLSKDDGPIMPFRKWCKQFYPAETLIGVGEEG